MVTRRQKLFAAAMVLSIGLGLAWPLRRDVPRPTLSVGAASVIAETKAVAKSAAVDPQSGPKSTPAVRSAPSVVGEPKYNTISNAFQNSERPEDSVVDNRIHVVHQGDSLERLAKRYLGDEARALEIFDLNREVLENPHLLPIGSELRIPTSALTTID